MLSGGMRVVTGILMICILKKRDLQNWWRWLSRVYITKVRVALILYDFNPCKII